MHKTRSDAGYNSRNPYMLVCPSRTARSGGFLLMVWQVILLSSYGMAATDWRSAEQQLAGKIAAVTGPEAVTVEIANRSSLSHAEVEQIRNGLLDELARQGVLTTNADQAAGTIVISLSQDNRSYVWVAEIHQGTNESSVVMIAVAGAVASSRQDEAGMMTIHKSLLWSQPSPILDVAVVHGNPERMIVLDPERIAIYGAQGSHWVQEQSLLISHSHPWPRDLRGLLVLRKNYLFDAFLPGTLCRSNAAVPPAMTCDSSDDPWPLRTVTADQPALNGFFAATRNYFTGALSPGIGKQTATSPFYSAAALPRDRYTLWLFENTDGTLHMLDGITEQTLPRQHWGSDIASVHSGCGSGWQILASTEAGSMNDRVQAFEVADREPIAASTPVDFDGGITALWATSEGSGAIAVSHNSATGIYEAFLLTIACGA